MPFQPNLVEVDDFPLYPSKQNQHSLYDPTSYSNLESVLCIEQLFVHAYPLNRRYPKSITQFFHRLIRILFNTYKLRKQNLKKYKQLKATTKSKKKYLHIATSANVCAPLSRITLSPLLGLARSRAPFPPFRNNAYSHYYDESVDFFVPFFTLMTYLRHTFQL